MVLIICYLLFINLNYLKTDSSLSKEEITSILYRISKNQSVAEVDKVLNNIII